MVNPSLLLGPGDVRMGSTRDVLSFLAGDVKLVPPGGINFVDARDVAAIIPVAMDKGRPGERYLLGGHNMTFAEYFDRIERASKEYHLRLKARGRWSVLGRRGAVGPLQGGWPHQSDRAGQRRHGHLLLVLRQHQGQKRAGLRPARGERHHFRYHPIH